ncbi:MAG: sigma-70 family RNA polymerase sigma factor [Coprobacillaceae bacterium]
MINYKIVVNGLNTNKKRLTHVETLALIDKYQATKDEYVKEQIVVDNARLVLSMTKRFYQRTDNMEDLFQVGMIGLIKAIENFNTSFDLRFSTYAVPLILGEMKRYLRDNSQIKISRTIRDLAYKILQVKEQYIQDFRREPTIKELSLELDEEPSSILEAMQSTNSISSLQEEIKNEDGNALTMMDQIVDNKKNREDIHMSLDLKDAIKVLSEKEKKVIDDRYFRGRSQMEIAEDLFISQAQVSRIEKQALQNLHKYLT